MLYSFYRMEINKQAPAYYQTSITIDVPIEIVWGIVSDIASWPSWNSDVENVDLHGPVTPGTSFKWKAGGATIQSRLVVVEAPYQIGWHGATMGIKAQHVFKLTQQGTQTVVTTEEAYEGLVSSILRKYLRKVLQTTLDKNLQSLKTVSEQRAGTPQ